MDRNELLQVIADTTAPGPRGIVGHDLAEAILKRIEGAVQPKPEPEPEPTEPEPEPKAAEPELT